MHVFLLEPTVKWYRNNAEIKANKFYSMTSVNGVSTLDIKEVHKEDEGEYKFEANNAAGKTACSATLKVTRKC